MFKPEYNHGWKKSLLIGLAGFVVGAVLLMTGVEPLTSIGGIILIVVPLVCICRTIHISFLNLVLSRRYGYVNKTIIPNSSDWKYAQDAINDGTAEVFHNELLVVTDEGIVAAVNDTCDFYPFSAINKIYPTDEFEGRKIPKTNFIKIEEDTTNYYVAIVEKWMLRDTYDSCAKACMDRFEKYQQNHKSEAV